MGREKVLQGATVEEKLDHVDLIFQRLLRRTPEKVKVMVPPVPICFYCQTPSESGLLGRWVAPVDGLITAFYGFVGFIAEKTKPSLVVAIKGDSKLEANSVAAKVGLVTLEVAIPVLAGQRIEISVNEPTSVSEISVSLLFTPGISKANKEKFLIDDILDKVEKVDAGTTKG